jgi:low temperature requirement protein LtrA
MFRILRVHTVAPDKSSNWLQLFFDLVYVAILVELGNRLGNNMDLKGVVEFALLFIPIWWSWLEFVDYGRHYPIDDIGQRALTVLYMGIMLVLAFEIHDLTGSTATAFVLTYGLSKLVLALMYGRAWIQFPDYRHLNGHQAVAFALAGFLWIVIAFIAPTNLWLWGLATALGVLAPLLIRLVKKATNREELPHPAIKYHFTMHRFGELSIIVLGEFFLKLVTSSAGRELTASNYIIGACLLGISVSLWWLYFDHLEHATLTSAGSRVGVWIYSHYPFLAAITAYGVVGKKIFSASTGQPLSDSKRLLFTTALAVAIFAYGAIELASREKDESLARTPQPWIRIASAAVILALGLWGGSLNVSWLVILVLAVLLVQVGLDVSKRLQRPILEIA